MQLYILVFFILFLFFVYVNKVIVITGFHLCLKNYYLKCYSAKL